MRYDRSITMELIVGRRYDSSEYVSTGPVHEVECEVDGIRITVVYTLGIDSHNFDAIRYDKSVNTAYLFCHSLCDTLTGDDKQRYQRICNQLDNKKVIAVVTYEKASQVNLRDNILFDDFKDLFGPRVIAVDISDESEFGKEFQRQQLIRQVAASVFGIDNRVTNKAYERACKDGIQTVCESRVMILGHYGAGKTSLLRHLLGEPFVKEHIPTTGIDADPDRTKVDVDITKVGLSGNWTKHKDDERHMKEVARHIITEKTMQGNFRPKNTASAAGQRNSATPVEQSVHFGNKVQKQVPSTRYKPRKETEYLDKKLPSKLVMLLDNKSLIETVTKMAVCLFFWDFAGQGLFYVTHQIFLLSRGIYIVVLDLTKGLEHRLKATRKDRLSKDITDSAAEQTVGEYLDYWLSCIYSTIGQDGSPGDAPSKPEVVIVCTHKDVTNVNTEQYKSSILEFIATKPYSYLVHPTIFMVSNCHPSDQDIIHLKTTLGSLAEAQKYRVPLKWFNLKEHIREDGRKTLTWAEFGEMGDKVGILREEDQKAALLFFRSVGDLVYFEDLPDFIVTDPQWLINQFKKIIGLELEEKATSQMFRDEYWSHVNERRDLDAYGTLSQSLLEKLWPSDDVREKVVKLMLKFALILPIEQYLCKQLDAQRNNDYIVPCLLPPARDSGFTPEEKEQNPPLLLKPVCNFLPAGLMARLISSLCTEDKWIICGPTDIANAIFQPNDNCRITLCTQTSPRGIEIRGCTDSGDDETTFKEPFRAIANRIRALPGTVDFDICTPCTRCKKPEKLARLSGIESLVKENPKVCDQNTEKLLSSDYAIWFCPQMQDPLALPLEWFLDKLICRKLSIFSRRLHIHPDLIMLMISRSVIDDSMEETIEAKSTHAEKVQVLMTTYLLKRNYKSKLLFFKCLIDTDQEHILQELGMSPRQIELISELD